MPFEKFSKFFRDTISLRKYWQIKVLCQPFSVLTTQNDLMIRFGVSISIDIFVNEVILPKSIK